LSRFYTKRNADRAPEKFEITSFKTELFTPPPPPSSNFCKQNFLNKQKKKAKLTT
jgi:hypothetical protein